MTFYTYILKCCDGSYYVGHTQKLTSRFRRHKLGKGAQYTAQRKSFELVYHESFKTRDEAMRREHQLKRWTRAKKEALIAGRFDDLRKLSRSYLN